MFFKWDSCSSQSTAVTSTGDHIRPSWKTDQKQLICMAGQQGGSQRRCSQEDTARHQIQILQFHMPCRVIMNMCCRHTLRYLPLPERMEGFLHQLINICLERIQHKLELMFSLKQRCELYIKTNSKFLLIIHSDQNYLTNSHFTFL